MGGMMFGNVGPVRREEVAPTLKNFQEQVLDAVGIREHVPVGSTGKKAVSGDLDVAVSLPPGTDRKSLARALQALPDLGASNVRAVGSIVSVSFPVSGSDGRAQIDLMFTGTADLGGIGWLMAGRGDEGAAGTYRNLLLSFAAKQASRRWGVKLSVSFPGGVQDPDAGGARTEDPQRILDVLGIDAQPEEVLDFESLLSKMKEQGWSDLLMDPADGFEAYMSRYLANERSRSKATRARDIFRDIMGLPPLNERRGSRRVRIPANLLREFVVRLSRLL